ncbi:MAG: hypothetical protein JNM93_11225 [Bacteriovoracaceae bacterium]|nr:hypothetical protein [Bacteriovoracaceae bacterium]
MKKFAFLALVLIFVAITTSQATYAQSGWSTSRYYSQQGSTSLACGPCYYDAYGYVVKNCQQRNWYTVNTCSNVYFWNYNTNSWYYQYQCGYFWTFSWQNFVRYCN